MMLKIIMKCEENIGNITQHISTGQAWIHFCQHLIGQYLVLGPWSYLGGMGYATDLCALQGREKIDLSKQ